MEMSSHSELRCQQRGISLDQVNLIISYGQKSAMPDGAWEYRLRKRTKTDSSQRLRDKSR